MGRSQVFQSHHRLAIVLLYLGSVLSGALTVLLGCILPRLSALDHLPDKDAGALLMVQFGCSACAALLVRRNFHQTLARGYGLISLAALALYLLPKQFALLAIAIYGSGLGLVMTSNSMLVGRIFTERRGSALSVLNLCWSVGAALMPLLIAQVFDNFPVRSMVACLGLLSALFVSVPFMGSFRQFVEDDQRVPIPRESPTGAIVYFGLLAFLYVGIESATGNWMSTYASRVVAWNYSRSVLATGCFWGALLLGRTLTPVVLFRLEEQKLYLISALGTAAGLFLLVAARSASFLLLGAAVSGISLAPIFPLTLSLFMAKAGQPRNSGWVFAVAGFGGAVLPWIAGILSSSARSLRIGLLAPAAAALLIILLALRLSSTSASGALKPVSPKPLPRQV